MILISAGQLKLTKINRQSTVIKSIKILVRRSQWGYRSCIWISMWIILIQDRIGFTFVIAYELLLSPQTNFSMAFKIPSTCGNFRNSIYFDRMCTFMSACRELLSNAWIKASTQLLVYRKRFSSYISCISTVMSIISCLRVYLKNSNVNASRRSLSSLGFSTKIKNVSIILYWNTMLKISSKSR